MKATTTTTSCTLNGATFKKIKNEIKKRSLSTLSNGVKTYVRMFGNHAANYELMLPKITNKEFTKAQIKEFGEIAKNKDLTYKICKLCIPTIDGVFVKFETQETLYKETGERISKESNWIKTKPISGNVYKPFGFVSETISLGGKPNYVISDDEVKRVTKVCVERLKFDDDIITKCIAAYLDLADEIKAKL